MNITELAHKPTLQEIVIDDPEILATYGEPITFWMFDQIGINTYFDFFKYQSEQNGDALAAALRKIICNQEGKPAIPDDVNLPIDVTLAALTKVNEHLGKSKAKLSKKEPGTPQE